MIWGRIWSLEWHHWRKTEHFFLMWNIREMGSHQSFTVDSFWFIQDRIAIFSFLKTTIFFFSHRLFIGGVCVLKRSLFWWLMKSADWFRTEGVMNLKTFCALSLCNCFVLDSFALCNSELRLGEAAAWLWSECQDKRCLLSCYFMILVCWYQHFQLINCCFFYLE